MLRIGRGKNFLLIFFLLLAGLIVSRTFYREKENNLTARDKILESPAVVPEKTVKPSFLLDVPFTVQAPFGEWTDPRQQDACEEASALLAVYWARGLDLNPEIAKEQILLAAQYQSENYGAVFQDTSAADTVERIFKGYFDYQKVYSLGNIGARDIVNELAKGNLVIVPVNGRRLNNPYYNQPGPLTHMLVVRGYDSEKDEFITNDVGTKQGLAYHYSKSILSGALQDYPTGATHGPQELNKTAMIVVEK